MTDLLKIFTPDVIGGYVAALLTILILTYILNLKPLYRLALHILIGTSAAYALVVAFWSIIVPRLVLPLLPPTYYPSISLASFGWVLGALVLCKLFRATAPWGNLATSLMLGVGLGVAAGGAVLGTLYAQGYATTLLSGVQPGPIGAVEGFVMLAGTITALLSFTFVATWRKGLLGTVARGVRGLSAVGRMFVYAALGAAFAGAYAAGISILVTQVQTLLVQFKLLTY